MIFLNKIFPVFFFFWMIPKVLSAGHLHPEMHEAIHIAVMHHNNIINSLLVLVDREMKEYQTISQEDLDREAKRKNIQIKAYQYIEKYLDVELMMPDVLRQIMSEIPSQQRLNITVLMRIAHVYVVFESDSLAIHYLEKALLSARQSHVLGSQELINILLNLYRIYAKIGIFEKAALTIDDLLAQQIPVFMKVPLLEKAIHLNIHFMIDLHKDHAFYVSIYEKKAIKYYEELLLYVPSIDSFSRYVHQYFQIYWSEKQA